MSAALLHPVMSLSSLATMINSIKPNLLFSFETLVLTDGYNSKGGHSTAWYSLQTLSLLGFSLSPLVLLVFLSP